jgi:transposase
MESFAHGGPNLGELSSILDNYGTYKHPNVTKWLSKHRRFHLHFTPTSSSWLNLIERWFGEISRKRIRRRVFYNEPDLIAAIEEFIQVTNANPNLLSGPKKSTKFYKKSVIVKLFLRHDTKSAHRVRAFPRS